MGSGNRPWLAALEGYYGPPLDHTARADLVAWLGAHDYDAYAYSPKNDPYARDRWRDPYPADELARFAELVGVGRDAGIDIAMTMNPGLDWRPGEPSELDALTAKLDAFRAIGVAGLAVAWDDVPGGGADLGREHGRAVAEVFHRLDGAGRWFTCPVDYSARQPTAYLRAFADALPAEVGIVWTGPGIVSPTLTAADATPLADALGRDLLFGENFPVNDGGMAHVMHLGPYPTRDASFVAATQGAVVNFMHRPLASRVGLAVAARFWRDPAGDRHTQWLDALGEFDGLEPLARACSSWVDDPEPDRVLRDWADAAPHDSRLERYLAGGCRTGLDPALAAELEPWLAQWEAEAKAMQAALWLLAADGAVTMDEVGALAQHWYDARRSETQAFGIRFAYYPVSERDGDRLVSDPVSVVEGTNLTDRLCRRALDAVRP